MALEGEQVFSGKTVVCGSDPVVIPVNSQYGYYSLRSKILEYANKYDMSKNQLNELEIILKELFSNVLKHGGGKGRFVVSTGEDKGRFVLYLDVIDTGDGFSDFDQATEEGYSTGGSLGGGLPAIMRLSNRLQLVENSSNGCHIRIVKQIRSLNPGNNHWEFVLFSRPHVDEYVNGDQGNVFHYEDSTIAVLVDGLGHGPNAEQASKQAILEIRNHKGMGVEDLIKHTHKNLSKTRGAALSLAKIDHSRGNLEWIGIGNVTGRLFRKLKSGVFRETTFYNNNGTLGVQLRSMMVLNYPVKPSDILILTTDGLKNNWIPLMMQQNDWDLHVLGKTILDFSARERDDASILVGRYTR